MTSNLVAPVVPRGFLDEEKLRRWCLDKSDTSQGDWQCTLFNLTHKSNERSGVITSFRFRPNATTEQRDAEITTMILDFKDQAQNIADLGPGVQGFVVSAHHSHEPDSPSLFQYHFNLRCNPGAIEVVGKTEEPDTRGITQQFMRLLESTIDQKDKSYQFMIEQAFKAAAATQAQNLQMNADMINYRITIEDLADRKADREAMFKREERDGRLSETVTNLVTGIGGDLVRTALEKKNLIKNNGKVDVNALRIMVENLQPDQLATFIKGLSPEQSTLFEPLIGPILLGMPEKFQAIQAINAPKDETK